MSRDCRRANTCQTLPHAEALEPRQLLSVGHHPHHLLNESAGTIPNPPLISSARWTGSGVVLTFSQPMDPATVENPRSYDLRPASLPNLTTGTIVKFMFGIKPHAPAGLAIRSATYDPTAQTVTLTPVRPLDASMEYEVSDAFGTPDARRPFGLVLEAASGAKVGGSGEFLVDVLPTAVDSPIPTSPVRIGRSGIATPLPTATVVVLAEAPNIHSVAAASVRTS
jgi:hypothetical protein